MFLIGGFLRPLFVAGPSSATAVVAPDRFPPDPCMNHWVRIGQGHAPGADACGSKRYARTAGVKYIWALSAWPRPMANIYVAIIPIPS